MSAVLVDGHAALDRLLKEEEISRSFDGERAENHFLCWQFISRSAVEERKLEMRNFRKIPEADKKSSSFVVLRVSCSSVAENSTLPISLFPDQSRLFTPRGVAVEVSSCGVDDWLRNFHSSTVFSLHCLNGVETDISVKAVALTKAFQLNKALRTKRDHLVELLKKSNGEIFETPFVSKKPIQLFTRPKTALPTLRITNDKFAEEDTSAEIKAFRPVMSEIVENKLFLSSAMVAGDKPKLQSYGITHILNLAGDTVGQPFPGNFKYLSLRVKDAKSEDLLTLFPSCFDFIESGMRGSSRILVHCVEGVSRSATVVIGYLMWRNKMTFADAADKVRKARPVSSPNAGFICQLIKYEKKLDKKRGEIIDELLRLKQHSETSEIFCFVSASEPLDPRFAYTMRKGRNFQVWIGSECTDSKIESEIKRLAWIEKFEANIEKEDKAWGLPIERRAEFDKDVPREAVTARRSVIQQSLKNSKLLNVVLVAYPELSTPLELFDSDDLRSDGIFVISSAAKAWVWQGNQSRSDDLEICMNELKKKFKTLTVVKEGFESQEFWDLFPDG